MWKAFYELECLGLIDERRPRMISVQSAVTQPIVQAFKNDWSDTRPVTAGSTRAVGLNVPGGVGHFRVLEILRESGGGAVAVGEDEIETAMAEEMAACGGPLSPEGAAAMAALPQLIEQGLIREGDQVVVFETGSVEKYE
jgi:threonine synthase